MIKKLVVEERIVLESDEPVSYEIGEIFSYFTDPETGKFYRPIGGYEVKGDDLEKLFVEIDGG